MDKQINVKNLSKQEKLALVNEIVWELLKWPPKELEECGLCPIKLMGAFVSSREHIKKFGKDSDNKEERIFNEKE